MVNKLRARIWTIRYLKAAGLTEKDLVAAYVTFLRPVAEYAVPSIHSLMTKEHSKMLETQQSRVLKVIYGFEHSYSALLKKSGLQTLQERRSLLTDEFAKKLQSNDRFTHLFPKRPTAQLRARNANLFVEMPSRSSRLYNSPIYYMRRRLNKMAVQTEGESPRLTRTTSQRCDFLFDEWR